MLFISIFNEKLLVCHEQKQGKINNHYYWIYNIKNLRIWYLFYVVFVPYIWKCIPSVNINMKRIKVLNLGLARNVSIKLADKYIDIGEKKLLTQESYNYSMDGGG